jgi:hypothetical protein
MCSLRLHVDVLHPAGAGEVQWVWLQPVSVYNLRCGIAFGLLNDNVAAAAAATWSNG